MAYKYSKFLAETRVVKSVSDFPAPIDGVILLENKVYRLDLPAGTELSVPYRFVLPEGGVTRIEGDEAVKSQLTYTGTGAMFSCEELGSLSLKELLVSAPNGSLLDVTSTSLYSAVYIDSVILSSISSLGAATDIGTVSITNAALSLINEGLSLNNINTFSCNLTQSAFTNNNATTCFSFDSGTFARISFSQTLFQLGTNERAFYFNPPATFDSVLVSGCNGDRRDNTYATGSLTHKEVSFYFSGNEGLPNSQKRASYYTSGNTTYTELTEGVWAKVEGTTITGDDVEKFAVTNNRATFINGSFTGDVSAAVSATSGTATDKICQFAIFKNGVIVPGSISERSIQNKTGAVPVQASVVLETNDYLELWVMNSTDDTDILISNYNLSVHE